MSDFLKRIKDNFNNDNNHRGLKRRFIMDTKDFIELIDHFESMDSSLRSTYDSKIPTEEQNRTACLAHEVQAAFHNLGVENTLDIVMFTIFELRKNQLKDKSIFQ